MKNKPADFWKKVDRRGPNECWRWTGAINSWGYGDCYYQGRRTSASRIAYELSVGTVPIGQVVCHSCDSPSCCNPTHLFVGTQMDNMRDKMRKGRGKGMFSSGARHPRHVAKLSASRVAEAKKLCAAGLSQSEVARRFGVATTTIHNAVHGKKWRHVP